MKKLIVLLVVGMLSVSANASIKCAPAPGGGMCCWDVDRDGPWMPINCQ